MKAATAMDTATLVGTGSAGTRAVAGAGPLNEDRDGSDAVRRGDLAPALPEDWLPARR
jgi:hypothetical protein